jgi:histidine triad (HIT) family protein
MNETNWFPTANSPADQESDRPSCPFCDIVSRRLDAAVLYEDSSILAFLDVTAVTEGHTLVIPKRHADDLWSISESEIWAVMRTVHRLANRLRRVLAPEGLTLFQANHSAGWPDVFHLHMHLVPRWTGDNPQRPWAASPNCCQSWNPFGGVWSCSCRCLFPLTSVGRWVILK